MDMETLLCTQYGGRGEGAVVSRGEMEGEVQVRGSKGKLRRVISHRMWSSRDA